ncbi:MAG: MotA/TolQ/ExbB proton channel family protein [Pirellulales bacterium]|nr:MotA/TolQ/ExbB proton channel family protein [Pirellulales bacterium]
MNQLMDIANVLVYAAQGVVALWGAFCVIVLWRRIAQTRFRTEEQQAEFLDQLDESLAAGDFDGAMELCDGDARAVPQLVQLAINNREIGYNKVRALLTDRFQRDVLADFEHRLSWVNTVIKTEPMLGLYGTVLGMMAAFGKLASLEQVDPTGLAEDISFALITTAVGLTVAIPLMICVASINVRIRKLEDLVGAGMTRFFESFKIAHRKHVPEGQPR